MTLLDRPALTLSVNDLRHSFSGQTESCPPPINNEDSLFFKDLFEQTQKTAAVLIPILDEPQGLQVLLTRRAGHLRSHAGQISFPGGSMEPQDKSLTAAALRETEEEIGLPGKYVEVMGRLGDYFTISGFRVTPVVGLISEALTLTADPNEVEEIIKVPLNHLMDPSAFKVEEHRHEHMIRSYYSTYYEHHRIWGVTAGIIMGFYEQLASAHLI